MGGIAHFVLVETTWARGYVRSHSEVSHAKPLPSNADVTCLYEKTINCSRNSTIGKLGEFKSREDSCFWRECLLKLIPC